MWPTDNPNRSYGRGDRLTPPRQGTEDPDKLERFRHHADWQRAMSAEAARIEAAQEYAQRHQEKSLEEVKKLFDSHKPHLDEAYNGIKYLRLNFDEINENAIQLQDTADKLLNQLKTKKVVLDLIQTSIASINLYTSSYKKLPTEIVHMIFGIDYDPIRNIKDVIDKYTSNNKLNTIYSEKAKNILTKKNNSLTAYDIYIQFKEDFYNSETFGKIMRVSLDEVRNAQNQVFECMTRANQMLHEELEAMHSKFKDLDHFLEYANPHYETSDKIADISEVITPLFKINTENNYIEITNKNNYHSIASIKKENWDKFNKNRNIITAKIFNIERHLTEMEIAFS